MTMNVQPVTLHGRAVRLEPLSFGHVAGLFMAGNDPDIWTYMPYGAIDHEEKMRSLVADLLARRERGTDMPFTIFDQQTDQPAGATRYMMIDRPNRGLEIGGSWLSRRYRRTAANTEAKYLLLRHAFEELGCIRVQLRTDLRNVRSQTAIERIGAVREGVFRKNMIMPDGHHRYSVFYSIIDEEWPSIKAKLEQVLEDPASR